MGMSGFEAFTAGWFMADSLKRDNQPQPPKKRPQKQRKNKTFRIGSTFGSVKEGALSAIVDQLIDEDTIEFTSDIIDSVALKTMVTIKGNGHRYIAKSGTIGLRIHNLCNIIDVHFVVPRKSNGLKIFEPELSMYLGDCTFEHEEVADAYPSITMQHPLERIVLDEVTVDYGVIKAQKCEGNTFQLGTLGYPRSSFFAQTGEKFAACQVDMAKLVLIDAGAWVTGKIQEVQAARGSLDSYDHDLQVAQFTPALGAFATAQQLEKVETALTVAGSMHIDQIVAPATLSDAEVAVLKKNIQLFRVKARPSSQITFSGKWPYASAWANQVLSGNVDFVNYNDQNLWTFHKEESKITFTSSDFRYRNKFTPKPKPKTAQDQLNEMIGLTDVKKKVNTYISTNLVNQKRKELGQPVSANSLHLIFSGSAGTGKTQVARLLAKILYSNGIITNPEIKEVMGKDLIGEYTGQTSPKTHKLIMEAKGGILFIDEAYELDPTSGGSDGYKREALTTLVKDMDDLRADLIVVMAGYTEEMAHLLKANDGLPSRFVNIVEFPDYSADELVAIAKLQIGQLKQTLTPDAEEKLTAYIHESKQAGRVDGNGRWVRNLLQFISQARDVRIVADGSLQSDATAINKIAAQDVVEGIANF
jgi:AAA+ superfamily predicted ATPase